MAIRINDILQKARTAIGKVSNSMSQPRKVTSVNPVVPKFLNQVKQASFALSKLTPEPINRSNQSPLVRTIGRAGEKGLFGPLPQVAATISRFKPQAAVPMSHFFAGLDPTGLSENIVTGGKMLPDRQKYSGLRTAGGVTGGLVTGGVGGVARSTAIGGVVGGGFKGAENIYNKRPVTENIFPAIKEGMMYGGKTSATFNLVNGLVGGLGRAVPFIKPLTDTAIEAGLPQKTMTMAQALKAIGQTGLKRIVKAALIETPIEGMIYGVKEREENQKLLESIANQTVQNLIFNVGFAGVNTLWDSRTLLPILKKSVDQAIEKYPVLKAENAPVGLTVKSKPGLYEELTGEKSKYNMSNFEEPYARGDIKKVEDDLYNILGVTRSNAYKTDYAQLQSAKEQLKYYADQGNEGAQKQLLAVNYLENQLEAARSSKGQANLGGGKTVPTVKVGDLNIEEPVAKAVSATFKEGSASSGFHRNLQKVSGVGPSWAIVYKKKPSKALIESAEAAGLKVKTRPNGITDVYLTDTLRGEPKKAQKVFDKFADLYIKATAKPFVPTTEWQEVPQGTAVPAGGEYRLDQASGKTFARWIPESTQVDQPNIKVEDTAYKSIVDNGGVTISLEGNMPKQGIAYAPFKNTEFVISKENFNESTVAGYLREHEKELSLPGNHLGAWESDGKIYLDISRVGDYTSKTLQDAINAKQLAAFDLETFTEIPLGKFDKGVYNKLYEATNHPYLNQRQSPTAGVPGVESKPSEVPEGQAASGADDTSVRIQSLTNENLNLLSQKAPGESIDAFLKRNPKVAETIRDNKNVINDLEGDLKQRRFLKQVQESPNTPPELAESVAELPQFYRQKANLPVWENAVKEVEANPDAVKEQLLKTNQRASAERTALYMALAQKYFREGNKAEATEMIRIGAEEATMTGQATQAWAMWSRMTPEGMIKWAEKQYESTNNKQTLVGKVIESATKKIGIKTKASGFTARKMANEVSTNLNRINSEVTDQIVEEIKQEKFDFYDKTFDVGVAKMKKVVGASASISNRLKNALESKDKQFSPVKDMVNTLYQSAKELLPKEVNVPRNPFDLIKQALKNKNEYQTVWELTQKRIYDMYGDNPEAMKILKPFIDKLFVEPFSQTQANKVMNLKLKELGVDFSKLVKEHYSNAENIKQDLVFKLTLETGLSKEEVKPLADYVTKRFDDLTRIKKEAILGKMIEDKKVKIPANEKGKKEMIDKLIELSNLGAFGDQKYYEAVSEKLGLPTMTPDLAAKIYAKMEKLQTTEDPLQRRKIITEVFDDINNSTPPGFSEIIDVMRYNGMLSGYKPQARNIFGNMFNLAVLRPAVLTQEVVNDWFGATLRGKDRQRYLKEVPAYYKGFVNSLPEAITAWAEGWKGIARNENPDLRSLRLRQFPKKVTFASNLLEAFDRFFTILGMQGELASLKARGIEGDDAIARAQNTAEQFIYRNQLDPKNLTGQGDFLSGWDKSIGAVQKLASDVPLIKWFIPFIRISGMVAKEAFQYTPVVSNLTKVGAEGPKLEQIKAKSMIGYMTTALGFALAMQDRTTFAVPTDPEKRKLFYDTGRIPYAIKVGNTWIPYINSPLIFAIGIPAAMKYYNSEDPKTVTKEGMDKWTSVLANTIKGQMRLFSSQTFLQNFNNLIKLVNQEDDVNTATVFAQTLGTINPYQGVLRTMAQLVDPTYRKASTFTEAIFKDLPGLSTLVPSYKNSIGEPSKRQPINSFLPYDVGVSNKQFELPYQLKSSQLQQNAVENKIEKDATKFIEDAKSMKADVVQKQLDDIKQNNPLLYEEIKKQALKAKKDKRTQLPGTQGLYATKPGQEPGRARYILSQIKDMSPEDAQNYIDEMKAMKVITPKVQTEMVKQMRSGQQSGTYGMGMFDKIKTLLSPAEVGAAEFPQMGGFSLSGGALLPSNKTESGDTTKSIIFQYNPTTKRFEDTYGNAGPLQDTSKTAPYVYAFTKKNGHYVDEFGNIAPFEKALASTKTLAGPKVGISTGGKKIKVTKKLLSAAGKTPKKRRAKVLKFPKIKKVRREVVKPHKINTSFVPKKVPTIKLLKVKYPTMSTKGLRV